MVSESPTGRRVGTASSSVADEYPERSVKKSCRKGWVPIGVDREMAEDTSGWKGWNRIRRGDWERREEGLAGKTYGDLEFVLGRLGRAEGRDSESNG